MAWRIAPLVLLLIPSAAGAANLPTIWLVPISDTRGRISGRIPASGKFMLKYRFGDRAPKNPILEVWPWLLKRSCTLPRGEAPQSYALPLEVMEVDKVFIGQAELPHLQVDRKFCFLVRWTELLEVPETAIEGTVDEYVDRLEGANLGQKMFEQWAGKLIEDAKDLESCNDECVGGEIRVLAGHLEDATVRNDLPRLQAQVEGKERRLERLRGQIETVTATIKEHLKNLPEGVADLVDLEAPGETKQRIAKALESPDFRLTTNGKQTEKLHENLVKLVNLRNKQEMIVAELKKNLANAEDAEDDFRGTLKRVATKYLNRTVKKEEKRVQGRASATTRDSANYVSPEVGIALGVPFIRVSESCCAWKAALLPYVAINIYFAPQERSLAFSEMVGTFWQEVAQRLSLTVGVTLTRAGDVDGVRLAPVVVDRYPVIGAGVRVLPFGRLSLLAFFYQAEQTHPLSERSVLYAAPAVSASFDTDVLTILQNAIGLF